MEVIWPTTKYSCMFFYLPCPARFLFPNLYKQFYASKCGKLPNVIETLSFFYRRRCGLMICVFNFGLSCPGSSTDQGHRVVFCSHGASFYCVRGGYYDRQSIPWVWGRGRCSLWTDQGITFRLILKISTVVFLTLYRCLCLMFSAGVEDG